MFLFGRHAYKNGYFQLQPLFVLWVNSEVVCEESHELSGSTIFNGRDIIKLFLLHSLSMIETLTGPSSVVSDIVWPQASR